MEDVDSLTDVEDVSLINLKMDYNEFYLKCYGNRLQGFVESTLASNGTQSLRSSRTLGTVIPNE